MGGICKDYNQKHIKKSGLYGSSLSLPTYLHWFDRYLCRLLR